MLPQGTLSDTSSVTRARRNMNGMVIPFVMVATQDFFSEACARAEMKNVASIAINGQVGLQIGRIGGRFAPTTRGLSLIPTAIGSYYWGLYGGDGFEYLVFDFVDNITEGFSKWTQ